MKRRSYKSHRYASPKLSQQEASGCCDPPCFKCTEHAVFMAKQSANLCTHVRLDRGPASTVQHHRAGSRALLLSSDCCVGGGRFSLVKSLSTNSSLSFNLLRFLTYPAVADGYTNKHVGLRRGSTKTRSGVLFLSLPSSANGLQKNYNFCATVIKAKLSLCVHERNKETRGAPLISPSVNKHRCRSPAFGCAQIKPCHIITGK